MIHYTYLIQSLDKTKNYIGSRSCKTTPEQDCYWGTSKHLPWGREGSKKDQSHLATKTILKTFDTKQEALAHEITLHEQFNVGVNPIFWNKAKQTSIKFDTTGLTLVFSELHVENMKKAHESRDKTSYGKGWRHTEEVKQKIANAQTGRKKTPEELLKLTHSLKTYFKNGGIPSMLGKSHKEETKQKISDKKKKDKSWTGTSNTKFKPWYIQDETGKKTVFYTITKEEKSILDGYKQHTYGTACSLSKGSIPIKKGKLKGLIIGNIT